MAPMDRTYSERVPAVRALLQRRKLKLKAKFESVSSYYSFNRWNRRRFQLGFDGVNLSRPTLSSR